MKHVRRRYLAVRAESVQSVDEEAVWNAIWDKVYQLFGEFGASQTALTMLYYDCKSKVLILRCSHKALDLTKAAITSVTEIDREPAALHVFGVSGTLKSLRKKISKLE